MSYTPVDIIWFFFIYAFLGWCAEVAFAALVEGKFVNRGFLNGPICPIYGFGVVAVILLLTPIQENFFILFLGSVLVTSFLEYITGFILEKVFETRWWDYTDMRFNLHGYVCLLFSLIWGFAVVFIMRIIHPMIASVIGFIPHIISCILLIIATCMIIADIIVTIAAIRGLQKRLRILTALSEEMHTLSDKIGDNLFDTVINTKNVAIEAIEPYAELREL